MEAFWGVGKGKGAQVAEDLTLGGGSTIQQRDDVSQNYTVKTHIILLTNVTPINLIKNKIEMF